MLACTLYRLPDHRFSLTAVLRLTVCHHSLNIGNYSLLRIIKEISLHTLGTQIVNSGSAIYDDAIKISWKCRQGTDILFHGSTGISEGQILMTENACFHLLRWIGEMDRLHDGKTHPYLSPCGDKERRVLKKQGH